MAKVLFIMKYPLVDAYSVKNKFDGQMRAAEALGHEVYFVGYDRKHTYLIHNGEKQIIKNIWFGAWKQYIHIKAFYDLFDSVRKVLKKEKFDVVYMRRCPLSHKGYRMCMDIVCSGAKLVEEVPTYPGGGEKIKSLIRRTYMRYSRYWWRKVHPKLTLYTLIGDHEDSIGQIPALNIENGTDVEKLPMRQPAFDEDKIHLLALASMSDWHGYDRLIRGLAKLDLQQREQVVLDMVGDGASLDQWKTLTKELGVEEYVIFHGEKSGPELDAFFNTADVGICSLGLYRIGFSSGSILKLREYMSRGLPFVYAASDPSLPDVVSYGLQIPNDDTDADIGAVVEFAEKMRKEPHMPEQMRQYAKENMTWETQIQKIFNKLNGL